MAQRAAIRRDQHDLVQQALYEMDHRAEQEEREREITEECRQGPPNGCRECYQWLDGCPGGWPWGPGWGHGNGGPPPPDLEYAPRGVPGGYEYDPGDWCWHACHGDGPAYVGPVWIG